MNQIATVSLYTKNPVYVFKDIVSNVFVNKGKVNASYP